jgi:hypothetical protein
MKKNIPAFIIEYERQGGNQKLFCNQFGIPYSKFYYHWRRYRVNPSSVSSPGFVSLGIKEEGDTKRGATIERPQVVRLYIGQEKRLELEGIFTPSFLRALAGC